MRGILPSGSANNKGTDQLAHPRSLISAFAILKLNSIVFKLARSETSLFLSSFCGWECWFLVWSYRKPWRQVLSHWCSYMHLYSCKCGPNPQTCFMRYAHRKCLAPLDYSWPIPPMTNADGIRTKDNTPSPSAPLNTPFISGKGVDIKRTFLI